MTIPANLETKRLLLRKWREDDIKDVIEGLNDFEVSKWLAYVPFPYTEKDARDWIADCIDNSQSGNRILYPFAIELKAEGKVIGGTSLGKVDEFHSVLGDGGIWINRQYGGNSYGIEAYAKRIDFAFNDLNLRRIESGFFDGNIASAKMHERLGFRIEGKRRKGYLCLADGVYKDEIITGLFREEWTPFHWR